MDLTKYQFQVEENLKTINEWKTKVVQSQNFDLANNLRTLEKSLEGHLKILNKITKLDLERLRKNSIQEIFKSRFMHNIISKEQNTQLEIELIKEFGEHCTLDGILNLESYNNSKFKILWILKEPNYGKAYNDNTDQGDRNLNDQEAKELYPSKKNIMNTYYSDIAKGYDYWQRTFKNILYITHGILEGIYDYWGLSDLESNARIEDKYYLDNIAFINVKKAPGSNKASGDLIIDSYNRHKDFLLKQIEIINPDIIFNCSSIAQLTNDLLGSQYVLNEDNCALFNGKLIINTYHPQQTTIKHEEYITNNLKLIEKYFKVD